MLNIKELEKRWFKYKIKSLAPYIIIIISLPIIVIISIILLNSINDKKKQISHKVIKQKKHVVLKKETVVLKKKIVVIKKEQIKKEIKPKQVKIIELKPSLEFMRRIQNSTQAYYDDSTNIDSTNIKKQQVQKQKITKIKPTIKKIVTKSKKIKIQIQNDRNDIKDIIKRFQKNNNPALSLFVAKKEYRLANYDQSYNYALITNKLNNNIEDSWIIFAKSLVKLGKKNQAIATLKKYIKYSHSTNAQVLLSEILSGKFI